MSNSTYKFKGIYEDWRHDPNNKNKWMCKKCHTKYISDPKRKPDWQQKYHKIFNPRQMYFKNKSITLKFNPRIGVCNLCRAIAGLDCKITHIHHEKYDQNDPLKHTIELCPRCHRMITFHKI